MKGRCAACPNEVNPPHEFCNPCWRKWIPGNLRVLWWRYYHARAHTAQAEVKVRILRLIEDKRARRAQEGNQHGHRAL